LQHCLGFAQQRLGLLQVRPARVLHNLSEASKGGLGLLCLAEAVPGHRQERQVIGMGLAEAASSRRRAGRSGSGTSAKYSSIGIRPPVLRGLLYGDRGVNV
jgi:hypothetical protein